MDEFAVSSALSLAAAALGKGAMMGVAPRVVGDGFSHLFFRSETVEGGWLVGATSSTWEERRLTATIPFM